MQPHRRKQIVVFGDINADVTVTIPTYPSEGDDSTAQDLRWGSGGSALNAATAFAILGGQARLLGRVGTDPAAAIALRAAQTAGVDIHAVQQDPVIATGTCFAVISGTGQRTFFSFRGANTFFDISAITASTIDHAHLIYINAHALLEGSQRESALQVVNIAATHGVPIALDLCLPTIRHCRNSIVSLLPTLWLLSMNEEELSLLLPGEIAESFDWLQAQGVSYVALKRGAEGCTLVGSDARVTVPPPSVATVDTNGCGDAFTAGCAWGLLHQAQLDECAILGNTLGALTATRPGSANALPDRTELHQWLAGSLDHLVDPDPH